MRIAIFHELQRGGARRAVNEFAKHLKKNNKIDLYTVDGEDNKDEKDFFDNVFFYKFIPRKWSGGNWKIRLYKDTIELYNIYKLHKEIARIINKKNYDLAFIHPSKFTQTPFILRFLKIPKIYYCEETLRIAYESQFELTDKIPFHKRMYDKLTKFVRKKIDKKNISSADTVLANSKFTRKNIRVAYGIESKVSYLGVDTDFFKPKENKKDIDILYIGSKDQIDGYNLLRSALRLIPKKISVKYHLTGEEWISDMDLRRLYNRSKIVVCLAKNEPLGLIPLEAAACSVPVIALDNGGYKETVINEITGYLIPRNKKILSQKLLYLLRAKDKLSQMGKDSRIHVKKRWEWNILTIYLEEIFKKRIAN